MNFRRFAIFAGWSILMMLMTTLATFVFTYGDCFGEPACIASTTRNFWIVIGSAFAIYWFVAIALFRRWNR